MNEITKVSDITAMDVAEYIRLPEVTTSDSVTLGMLLTVAKTYIANYTGIALEDLDNYADFVIVVFILCQDMWDNRTMYVDNSNLNNVVETILGLHSINLLPKVTTP